jgi:uncharacterized protein
MTLDPRHNQLQQLVAELATALVDHPEAVQVQSLARGEDTVLRLRVAPSDIGKVIGKQGRTARSLRNILAAASMKLNHRYLLDILEEGLEGNQAENQAENQAGNQAGNQEQAAADSAGPRGALPEGA